MSTTDSSDIRGGEPLSLAGQLASSHPDTHGAVQRVVDEVHRLTNRLQFAEHLVQNFETSAAAADAQIQRQTAVLLAQADQLERSRAQLRAVRALCDLAEWSAESIGVRTGGVLRVADVRRALTETDPA